MFDFIIHTSLKQRLIVLGVSLLLIIYGADVYKRQDLLTATLAVGEVQAAASVEENSGRPWWLFAGISLLLLCGGLVARRLRRQARERVIHHV